MKSTVKKNTISLLKCMKMLSDVQGVLSPMIK